jgi:GNAT superfamily N-acetyltransferase
MTGLRVSEALEFRTYAPADTDAVAVLWNEGWHDGHGDICPPEINSIRTPETFAARLPLYGSGLVVAEDDDSVAAFAALVGPLIDQFFVARRARGSGLARAFLTHLETIIRRNGDAAAKVECIVGNERAFRFYTSCGYVDTGVFSRPVWARPGERASMPMHCFYKTLDP